MAVDERVERAYSKFRDGFRHVPPAPPPWSELEEWMRDALIQMFLAGFLKPREH